MRLMPRIRELKLSGMDFPEIQKQIFKEFNRKYTIYTLQKYSNVRSNLDSDQKYMDKWKEEYKSDDKTQPIPEYDNLSLEELHNLMVHSSEIKSSS